MELLNKLGIDWRLLIAQLINFCLVLLVLYKFLYKPLLKILAERESKIKNSLTQVDQIEKRLKETEKEAEGFILSAKKQAQEILAETEKLALERRTEQLAKTKQETEKIIQDAKVTIQHEKETMIQSAKDELAGLVASLTEKFLHKKLTAQDQEKLLETLDPASRERLD